jgi:uncharacterized protein (TIGR00645 family)
VPLACRVTDTPHRPFARAVHAARWFMAPIYLGLFVAMAMLVVKFVQTLVALGVALPGLSGAGTVLAVLQLVDLALVANLVLIVVLAGWDGVIGLVSAEPARMADFGFGALKVKLLGSIVSIAAIQLLEGFVHAADVALRPLLWQLMLMLGFAVAGVLLAVMDRLGEGH